jgi:hypothetical protein
MHPFRSLGPFIVQDNIRLLSSVASLIDMFTKQYNYSYPAAPVTWTVQSFGLNLSSLTPPTAEGYLDIMLKQKPLVDAEDFDVATANKQVPCPACPSMR